MFMKVLGIDPGFDRLGFGLIETAGSDIRCLEYGCLYTEKDTALTDRLRAVYESARTVLEKHNPDTAVVEHLYFSSNVTTAINVGMARGVILLAIAEAHIPLIGLTPNQVKQGVTGYGNADKAQVQDMVRRLLNLKEIPKPDDAADALAMAIVGSQMRPK